CANGFTGLDSW
nr:immunoglobulin heavy chain junction region [Macaca mulatta]